MTEKLLARKEGRTGIVTFNNPERHNAMSLDMWEATVHHLNEYAKDPEVRVLVLTGAGGKAFVSGADISKFEDERSSTEGIARYNAAVERGYATVHGFPKPTIAMIRGYCIGGGMGLASCCDIRICSPNSRFAVPAAKLGLLVDHWTIQRLSLLAGAGPARAMLLGAETYSGEDAARLGFVQRLGDLEGALGWADEVAALAPLTLAGSKLALNRLEMPVGRGDDAEVHDAWARAWASEDLQEGMAAFRERRRPVFHGR